MLHATEIKNQQAASRPDPGTESERGEGGEINLGDGGGEMVVLDHVAEHDEHGEGEEARHHLPRVDRHWFRPAKPTADARRRLERVGRTGGPGTALGEWGDDR